MTGHWAAVGEMAEEIQKDEEPILEVMITLQELKEKTKIIRTDDEVKRGTESLQGTKKTQKLRRRAQKRDDLRIAGMAMSRPRAMFGPYGGRPGGINPQEEEGPDLQKLLSDGPGALEGQWLLGNTVGRSKQEVVVKNMPTVGGDFDSW